MHNVISSFIEGIPIGCVFALVAVGFVLTYKVSGVFNLAFGAQAYASAAVYYELRVKHGWPIPPAAGLAVLVFAPLLGLVLYWGIFRHLRNAPQVARLAVSIGLLLALPEIVKLAFNFGSAPLFGVQGIVGNGDVIYNFGSYAFFRDDLATIIVTLAAVLGLTLMFRYTAIGLRMRAVVESARMTELAGISSDRVSSTGWVLSSAFAGMAGLLLGPLYPQLSSQNFFLLVVAAVRRGRVRRPLEPAARFGGRSRPRDRRGDPACELPTNSILAQGLRPSLPFVVLFLVLILKPSLRRKREFADPLAGVDPPPPALAADERGPGLTRATHVVGIVLVLVALWYFGAVANSYWLSLATQAVIFSIIFLSITVFTGMAGQISLAQGSFAANRRVHVWSARDEARGVGDRRRAIGVAIAAAIGALLAIPALRLGGIYLALATLAFALFFESVIVKFTWASGGQLPITVPRPTISTINFTSDRSFLLLCTAALLIVGFIVVRVRSGITGHNLRALDGSEIAASSIGINPTRARITAFALSAGIAGLGGALLSMREGAANYDANFSVAFAMFWVVLVVTLGTRTVEGAVVAAIALKFFPELLNTIHVSATWQIVLFGLGAITFARHPEGILEYQKSMLFNRLQRVLDRRESHKHQESAPALGGDGVAARGSTR